MIKVCYKFKRLPKKSQNRVCTATLFQSFNCSSCYDLWQSWLLWKSVTFI